MEEAIKQIQELLAQAQMKLRLFGTKEATEIADKLAALEKPMRQAEGE